MRTKKYSVSVFLLSLCLSAQTFGQPPTGDHSADENGAHAPVTGAPVACQVFKDGKVSPEKVHFQFPKDTDLDTVVVKQKEAGGRPTVLIRTIDPDKTLAEDGSHVIHLTKVSTSGDEAVEISLRMLNDEIVSYEVGKVCGKGFGFPKAIGTIEPVIEEDEAKLRDMLAAGDQTLLSLISNPDDEDLAELKGGGGGGGGGSSRSSGGGGGGSSRSSGGGGGGSSSRSSGGGGGGGSTSRSSGGGGGGGSKSGGGGAKAPSSSGFGGGSKSGGGSTHSDPRPSNGGGGGMFGGGSKSGSGGSQPKSSNNDSGNKGPKPSNNSSGNAPKSGSNLKLEGGHKQTVNKDGSITQDRGDHQVTFRKDEKTGEFKPYQKTAGDKVTTYNGKGDAVQVHDKSTGDVSTFKPGGNSTYSGGGSRSSNPPSDRPKPISNNLKLEGGHDQKVNRDGSITQDRGSHKITFRKDEKTGEFKPYQKIVGDKVTTYNGKGEVAQVKSGRTVTNYDDSGVKSVYHGSSKTPAYTERTINTGGQTRIQRTVNVNNRTVVNNYNYYDRGGYGYRVYDPVFYDPWVYRPFYNPYYSPWVTNPYVYSWGFYNDPWYGTYGGYFRPYPTYSHPAYWLTDYLISDMLQTRAHEEQQLADSRRAELEAAKGSAEAAAQHAEQAAAEARAEASRLRAEKDEPITQEIKDQIKIQVEEAIKAREDKRILSMDEMSKSTKYLFAVAGDEDIEATDSATGKPCLLTRGDLIQLTQAVEPGAKTAQVRVKTSKRGSCPAGSVIDVSMEDLQEYLNEFMAGIDRGLGEMKEKKVLAEKP